MAQRTLKKIKGSAYKCRCNSVWCPQCFVARGAKDAMAKMRLMAWDHVRHVVVTVCPSEFRDGQEAWEYVTSHKMIAGLIRNIERGKKVKDPKTGKWKWLFYPVKIRRWMWFLEWHENGFPHWHILIETEAKGRAGMIGGGRLRHYWKRAGRWVREDYIRSEKHWQRMTGYFGEHGYFNPRKDHAKAKLKDHQMRLPAWAMDLGGSKKIRRTGGKIQARRVRTMDEFLTDMARKADIIDIKTGEIIRPKKGLSRKQKARTYRAILASCGSHTRIKIYGRRSYLDMIVNIPYQKLRELLDGEYQKGRGYCFGLTMGRINWFLDHVVRVINYQFSENLDWLWERLNKWREEKLRVIGGA